MLSFFRNISRRGTLTLRMSNPNIRNSKSFSKAEKEIESNPYYEKYADKIVRLQQCTPEEFLSRMEKLAENKNKKSDKAGKERPYSTVTSEAKPKLDASNFQKPKKLDDVMKTELLVDKSADEIKELWLNYHRNKDVICGVIPKETYSVMKARGEEFSTFVLPIPRSQGYEFIVCQFVGNEVHFTPLIAYQTHKENAPECLTISHYPDLQDDKGIVLMKGEYDKNILNSQEAQCLANELQLYYAQNNEKRLNLLKRFTYKPEEFKHMDLIAEVETLSL